MIPYDPLITRLAEYALAELSPSDEALNTASLCLMDSLGCGMLALDFPECTRLLGPQFSESSPGSPIPGTAFRLNALEAAFSISCMNRWLDFNDTWLAREWGHPSDNLGALLAAANHQNLLGIPLSMHELLIYLIKAYEIQGLLAEDNAFNRVGLDHVILVKVASTACAGAILGLNLDQLRAAISQAWIDGQSLRTYRHAPNTGARKSWAAGDAATRALRLCFLTLRGEAGYPTALSAKIWGFQDVYFGGEPLLLKRELGCYVIENILFKVSFPAEFHAQTAVEAGFALHPEFIKRRAELESIHIRSHESALRIISKQAALTNPADRDHCLQYMLAVALLNGSLTAAHYADSYHLAHPEIDLLRAKMHVTECPEFSSDYLDPAKRSIANSITLCFSNGDDLTQTCEFPLGHRQRRAEARPQLIAKFQNALHSKFSSAKTQQLQKICLEPDLLRTFSAHDFLTLWVRES